MLHSETFEVVCHLVCGTGPKLYRGHLHREDGFVGDIKATHTVFSQLHLASVSLQELQSGLVKLVYLLIDRCVGTPLENHQLSMLNVLLVDLVGILGRRPHPVTAPSDRTGNVAWLYPNACMNAATSSAKSSVV